MSPCLIHARKPSLWLRFMSLAVLILLLSGWTCSAMVAFSACPGNVPEPQIVATLAGQHGTRPPISSTGRKWKRPCSPITNHVERERTANNVHGFAPPSDHDYAADVRDVYGSESGRWRRLFCTPGPTTWL